MNNGQLTLQFLLQIAVILAACRVVGGLARRWGQPQVVGEMITGILLGPSLLGLLLPDFHAWLFPWDAAEQTRDTQSYLYPVAQLGLVLYMFVVGLEFDLEMLRDNWRPSLAVSTVGMLAPFGLGFGLAWLWQSNRRLFPEATDPFTAAAFLGTSLCITAFPMLARIIQHKGLTNTRIGAVSLGAGALGDAAAWGLLSLLLASMDQDRHGASWVIGGSCLLMAGVWLLRPLVRRLAASMTVAGRLTEGGLVFALTLMALGAWVTEWLGLHAVFGAFLVGVIFPRGVVSRDLIAAIQPLTAGLLLPLFFTYSGLNTRLSLLDSFELWGICAMVLVIAVLGKGVACWWAARATGIPDREAWGIGTLMNARGLMELIVINIGLKRGVITPELFAVLALMAVATTLMTSPLFEWLVAAEPVEKSVPCESMEP